MAEYKSLSLREAAKFDFQNNLKSKLTGWGKICKDRAERGVSRKARRRAKANE
jgi:hypothetical protein